MSDCTSDCTSQRFPIRRDLCFYRGDTATAGRVWWISQDFGGASARMQFEDASGGLLFEVTPSVTANSAPNPLPGGASPTPWSRLEFNLTAEQLLQLQNQYASYDLELTLSGGSVLTLFRGRVTLEDDVTRVRP